MISFNLGAFLVEKEGQVDYYWKLVMPLVTSVMFSLYVNAKLRGGQNHYFNKTR